VIAHTTIKFTRQHDIVSFSLAPACRQILWSDDPWTGREIEPAWENYFESQGYKLTETCKECGFTKLYVLCRFYLLRFRPFPRPRRHRGAASNVSRQKAAFEHPEPTMMNWGNASNTCASIPQDTAEHNRADCVVHSPVKRSQSALNTV